jgi:acetyl esterase
MSDEPSVVLDVVYGAVGSAPLLLDVDSRSMSPDSDRARAAVVSIYGGGWFCGDKSKERSLASILVDSGHLVLAPNCREAPEGYIETAIGPSLAFLHSAFSAGPA